MKRIGFLLVCLICLVVTSGIAQELPPSTGEDTASASNPFTIDSPISLSRHFYLALEPVDGYGENLEISIREIVLQQIPLALMYEVAPQDTLPDNFGAVWTADSQQSTKISPEFLFTSNRTRIDVTVTFSAQGEEYRWERNGVDLPLYAGDPIFCDASLLGVPENEILSAQWSARDHFGGDALNITSPLQITTTAVSSSYNSVFIKCAIERTDGGIDVTEFPILIYPSDGAVFDNGGFAGTFFEPYSGITLATIVDEVFETMSETGATTLVTALTGFYGRPDPEGFFTVEEIYDDSRHHMGYTLQEFQLQALVDRARLDDKKIEIQIRTVPYKNDSSLQSEYSQTGGGPNRGFKMTPGFIEGRDGQGLQAIFLNHLDFFAANQDVISMVYLGAETSDVETSGGTTARNFFASIIAMYREAGYNSGISHATHGGNWDTAWHWDQVSNPDVCGFPWGLSTGPAVTFYVPLAFEATEIPSRYVMAERAERYISTFVYPLYEAYDGPLNVEDLYCQQTAHCLFDPVGGYRGVARDIDLAMQWHLIWANAFANLDTGRGEGWLDLFCISEYRMMPNDWVGAPLPDWAVKKAYLNPGYDHEDYRAIVSLLFRDIPRASYSIGFTH